VFDRRYASGFGPPWFPSTPLNLGAITPGTPVASFYSVQWVNHTPFD